MQPITGTASQATGCREFKVLAWAAALLGSQAWGFYLWVSAQLHGFGGHLWPFLVCMLVIPDLHVTLLQQLCQTDISDFQSGSCDVFIIVILSHRGAELKLKILWPAHLLLYDQT